MATNTINANRIDFIICTDDMLWFSECKAYIRNLHVPDGMSVGVIPVRSAKSMCNGYNTGMRQSSARYKVYLHHDMFIINQNFITDILHIFAADARIGIIGLIGSLEQKQQDIFYSSWEYGSIIANNGFSEDFFEFGAVEDDYQPVDFVDGMLIATQYDLPWREDIFTEWDFYDKSICMEFRRQGYLTVVPRQDKPWCIHDCDPSGLFHWKENAQRFVHTYPEFFPPETVNIKTTKNISASALEHLRTVDAATQDAFLAGDYPGCLEIIHDELTRDHDITKSMVTRLHVSLLYQQNSEKSMLFRKDADPESMCVSYIKARFFLRRLCYGLPLTDGERTHIERLLPEEKEYITNTELTYSCSNASHPDASGIDDACINQRIRRLIQHGKLGDAAEICITAVRGGYVDKETYIFFILFLIRMREQADGVPDIFQLSGDPDVLINHYRVLKFLIRRQEFLQMEPLQGELYSYCRETNTSAAALETIIEYSTLEPERIKEKVRKELENHV